MDAQERFARRIVARLEDGLESTPRHAQARLANAREQALDAARARARSQQAQRVGGGVLAWGRLGWRAQSMGWAMMAALLALTLGLAQYGRIQASAREAADVDEVILSDDAPVQSYTDPGFGAVLRSGLIKSLSTQSDGRD